MALEILKESYEAQKKKVDKALNSKCIDIDAWDEKNAPMIIPKCIATAILIDESRQFDGAGTSFYKEMKEEVKNIGYHL